MQLPINETPEGGLYLEIPDALVEKAGPLLAKLGDLVTSSAANLSDAEIAELREKADRLEKAEAELNDVRSTVQNLSREQWIEIGVRLGFLNGPTDDAAALSDAGTHKGEFYLPEFKVWLKPGVERV